VPVAKNQLKLTLAMCGPILLHAASIPIAAAEDAAAPATAVLEEVIVTAQKREERLQDVPAPVTAVSADTLVQNNELRIEDYYTSVPGLSVTSDSFGQPSLSIRGVTTAIGTLTNPTVGVVVDDIPFGSTTPLGGGAIVPDIDPSDLQSIEVLRGPQGTLYGASSLGGLLKFVTADPSTAGVSGHVQASVGRIHNSDSAGYGVRGSINVPLGDTLALRASAFTRDDKGYIDDLLTGQKAGGEKADGARLALLWRPSDAFQVKLSGLVQESRSDTAPLETVGPGLGDLQQQFILNSGAYYRRYQALSATLTAHLAGVTITSLTGYNINSLRDSQDNSIYFGDIIRDGIPDLVPAYGVSGSPLAERNTTTKFSEELRVSGSIGPTYEWLVSGFFTHENSPYTQSILAEDIPTGAIVGHALDFNWHDTYDEYAALADLTVHFTDRFDTQFGARESFNHQVFTETDVGPWTILFDNQPPPVYYGHITRTENSFTYLVTPRFKLTPDQMIYARIASGYRPGGPNDVAQGLGVPPIYHSDTTTDYELGYKSTLLDRKLTIDASIYYIDWKNMQLTVETPSTIAYFSNGSRSKSEGVEVSLQMRPLRGLTVAMWGAWDEAALTQNFPSSAAAYGVAGNRLPYSPKISGSLSADYDFPLTSKLSGYVGGNVDYVGERLSGFQAPPPPGEEPTPRDVYPAYAKTNFRTGVKFDDWTVSVFVNNAFDRRGTLSGNPSVNNVTNIVLIAPRTVGMSVARSF